MILSLPPKSAKEVPPSDNNCIENGSSRDTLSCHYYLSCRRRLGLKVGIFLISGIMLTNFLVMNRNTQRKNCLSIDNFVNSNSRGEQLILSQFIDEEKPSEYATATVAFVVTITGCDANAKQTNQFMTTDAGAVLAYSIHKNSIHGPNGGRYNYDLYAFHHPNASSCAKPLEKLGYIVQERDTPIALGEIRNEQFREHVQEWGCCGERELIKFEAFTLTEYPVVVLLDLDTLVLKPLDRLFDFLLDTRQLPEPDDLLYVNKPAAFGRNTNVTIPAHLDLLFTIDYATVDADMDIKPFQGGFNMFRPNVTVLQDIMEIVREGDYRFDGTGWGGSTGSMFWGDSTFQGLMPYYFQILYPGRALELNYCIWNENNYPPTRIVTSRPESKDLCTTLQENCEDCRVRPLEEVGLLHYTVCYKPWLCYFHTSDDHVHNTKCHVLLREWFKTRSEMEESWGRSGRGSGKFWTDRFFGYCHGWGDAYYEALQEPFSAPLNTTGNLS